MNVNNTVAPKRKLNKAKSYISLSAAARMVLAAIITPSTPLKDTSPYNYTPPPSKSETPSHHEMMGLIFKDITGQRMPNLNNKRNAVKLHALRITTSTSINVVSITKRKGGGDAYIGVADFMTWCFSKRELLYLSCYLSGLRKGSDGYPDMVPPSHHDRLDAIQAAEKGAHFFKNSGSMIMNPHVPDFSVIKMDEMIKHDEVIFSLNQLVGLAPRHVRLLSEVYCTLDDGVITDPEVFLDQMNSLPVGVYTNRDLSDISELPDAAPDEVLISCKKTEDEIGASVFEFDWNRKLLIVIALELGVDSLINDEVSRMLAPRSEADLMKPNTLILPDPTLLIFKRERFSPGCFGK